MSYTETNTTKLIEYGKQYLNILPNLAVMIIVFILFFIFLFAMWFYYMDKSQRYLRTIALIVEDKKITDDELALYSHEAKQTFYQKWRRKLD